jgi:hypothetical protein
VSLSARHWAIGLVAITAFGLGALVAVRRPTGAPQSARQDSSADPRAAAPSRSAWGAAPLVVVIQAEKSPAPAVSVQTTSRPAPMTPEEIAANLEQNYVTEARSASGRNLEHTIREELEAPEVHGVRLEQLECRTSRCKLVLTFDNLDADKRVFSQVFLSATSKIRLAGSVPWRETLSDGKIRATMYLHPDEAFSAGGSGIDGQPWIVPRCRS